MKRLTAFFMSGVLVGSVCSASFTRPFRCSWATGAGAIAVVCR